MKTVHDRLPRRPPGAVLSAIPKRKTTAAEYLAIERDAPFKSEFHAGEMFAMSGASPAHIMSKDKLIGLVAAALRGSGSWTRSATSAFASTPPDCSLTRTS